MKKIRPRNKQGVLTLNNVILEKHEMATVAFLLALGSDIELLPPSSTPGVHNADFFMNGLVWEAKSPNGNSTRMTIDRILHKAARQSENIVIDLRRTKLPEEQSLLQIEKRFKLSRRIRRVLVVTKQGRLVDFIK